MANALIDNYTKEQLEEIVKNSFSMKEVIDKLGYATHSGSNNQTVKSRIEKYNIDTSHFIFQKGIKRTEENVFIENSTASQATLRKWYKNGNYTEYKCSICGQEPIWQGKDLTLILDHINGRNHDDRLENLRWVCPNCNQQLDTTNGKNLKNRKHITSNGVINIEKIQYFCKDCGKEITRSSTTGFCKECVAKKSRIVERPTKEELKILIRNKPFTQIANQYGVTDNSIRKWCDAYNLPRKKTEINSYSDEEWDLL